MSGQQPMTERTHTPKCPICRKPAAAAFRPFCSKRCADVDLNRWFSGAYVVAGKEEEDEDGASRPVPSAKDEPDA